MLIGTLAAIASLIPERDGFRERLLRALGPLQGELNVVRFGRDDQYFADMTAWNNRGSYEQTVDERHAAPAGRSRSTVPVSRSSIR